MLYSFGDHDGDGLFPYDSLTMDGHNVQCVRHDFRGGADNVGNVFELTPTDGALDWSCAAQLYRR